MVVLLLLEQVATSFKTSPCRDYVPEFFRNELDVRDPDLNVDVRVQ